VYITVAVVINTVARGGILFGYNRALPSGMVQLDVIILAALTAIALSRNKRNKNEKKQ